MENDIKLIKSVKLEVSTDKKTFHLHREINESDIGVTFAVIPSALEFLSSLIEAGHSICHNNNYKSFRLKVILERESFFVYADASQNQKSDGAQEENIPDEEREKYDALTDRERQVLCFLYRGYKQDAIAYVFGLTVHSIKKYRHNIYSKAGFRNRTEMAVWCEKYLHSVFKMTA